MGKAVRAMRALLLLTLCASACAASRPVPETPRATASSLLPPATLPPPATTASVSKTEARAVAALGSAWGTPAPIAFVAASPERRWVAFCQARVDTDGNGKVETKIGARGEITGDRLDGYFADDAGEGVRIDSFAGADPTGRFVAFVREGRLALRDTTTGMDVFLGADLRDDGAPFMHPRFAAFSATGARFLYAVKEGTQTGVRVRDLETGAEVRIDAGAGDLYRAEFDPSGRRLIFTVAPDGDARWPVPERTPWMRCAGPLAQYPVWERPTETLVTRVATIDGARTLEVPGLVVVLGKTLVVRGTDGALETLDQDGARTPLVKKECAAHVLHADASRELLVATCAKKKSARSELLLVRGGTVTPLGFEVAGTFGDRWLEGAPRLVTLYPGADTMLLDVETGKTELLRVGDRVLASTELAVLVARGTELVIHDFGGVEVKVPGTASPLSRIVRTRATLAVPPLVVDLDKRALTGTTASRPLAVALDGSVLTPERDADAVTFAEGPLRWKACEAPYAQTSASR